MTLTNCLFIQNEAESYGGAVYSYGNLLIEDCNFSLNLSKLDGGAVCVDDYSFWPTARISRSRFLWNSAWGSGGGLFISEAFSPTKCEVLQSVFVGNTATNGPGGAVYSDIWAGGTISLHVVNSTFAFNSSKTGGGIDSSQSGVTTGIENSILWGNAPTNLVVSAGSQVRVRTSCLSEAAKYPAARNISADPKLVNVAGGDVRLQSGSPCIDAGNNYIDYEPSVPGFQLLPATDLDGDWRIVDGNSDGTATVDMGAYENQGQ